MIFFDQFLTIISVISPHLDFHLETLRHLISSHTLSSSHICLALFRVLAFVVRFSHSRIVTRHLLRVHLIRHLSCLGEVRGELSLGRREQDWSQLLFSIGNLVHNLVEMEHGVDVEAHVYIHVHVHIHATILNASIHRLSSRW